MFEDHLEVGHYRTVKSMARRLPHYSEDDIVNMVLSSEDFILLSGFKQGNCWINLKRQQDWLIKRV